MFVSKLFEALANVILNTTVPSPTPLVSDQLNKQGSRSVIESTSVENDSSEEASSGVDEETSSAETATEEVIVCYNHFLFSGRVETTDILQFLVEL